MGYASYKFIGHINVWGKLNSAKNLLKREKKIQNLRPTLNFNLIKIKVGR
jgi:hypothetical protein